METFVSIILIGIATFGIGMFFQACREEDRTTTGYVVVIFFVGYVAQHVSAILSDMTQFAEPLQILNRYSFGLFAFVCALAILALPLGLGAVLNTTVQPKSIEATFRLADAAAVRRSIFLKRKPRRGTNRRRNHHAHSSGS